MWTEIVDEAFYRLLNNEDFYIHDKDIKDEDRYIYMNYGTFLRMIVNRVTKNTRYYIKDKND
jgi:hypothetical protein|tara:strand:+ start:5177 stop:5362 length:186 start_codon:yes stop_codon:yes gene_type:complete